MNKFLYFLLGMLTAAASVLAVTLAHQAGSHPGPSVTSSASTVVTPATTRPAPHVLATPTHVPTHRPTGTHSPARTAEPTGGTHDARCQDGTITHKAGHRGACSGHGGLA